ncbi:hypothetical protein PR048_005524 [Dryococelus australis]|uniref:Uncharacterized protein n=1 Tax=Dryococelus australis TaxID=614101 RepID=A0ABQ9IAK5_9NEOP|nr:hypothetical protein PR048_005524 [Dryococelus australis]
MAEVNKLSALVLTGNLSENWYEFEQHFYIFMIAQGKVKVVVFLNIVGEDAVKLFNTFKSSRGCKKKYEKVIEAFENYVRPKKNVPYKRFLLYSQKQKGEPFQHFLTDLKKLICTYLDQGDILRDCVFMGMYDKTFQKEILKTQELALEKACELVNLSETSRQQLKCLQNNIVYPSQIEDHHHM